MSRFTTARDVFDAFPAAHDDIEAEPTDDPPLVFLRGLVASPTPENGVTFCAYLLPRREAVWWACQCVRALNAIRGEAEEAALEAAEAWVREPEEGLRRAALELGGSGDQSAPSTWLAYAAAWSGGSMTTGDPPVPAPPHLTAKAVRAAVLMALARVPVKQRRESLGACLKEGMRLAGEEAAPARR
jgi:hypothetical protein